MFRKKEKFKEGPMETVDIKLVNEQKLLKGIWDEIVDHCFITTGPNDGRPLSVVREDDVLDILNRRLENGEKLSQY